MLPGVAWVPSFWGLHSGDERRHCTLGLGKCGAHWSLRSGVPLMTSRKKRCLSRDKMMSRDPSSKRREGEEAESKVLWKWEYTAQDKKCTNYGRSKNLSGRVKFISLVSLNTFTASISNIPFKRRASTSLSTAFDNLRAMVVYWDVFMHLYHHTDPRIMFSMKKCAKLLNQLTTLYLV